MCIDICIPEENYLCVCVCVCVYLHNPSAMGQIVEWVEEKFTQPCPGGELGSPIPTPMKITSTSCVCVCVCVCVLEIVKVQIHEEKCLCATKTMYTYGHFSRRDQKDIS